MSLFNMPSLGADMEEGTLVEWLVGPGDRVSSGDVIAVVETHKGAIEIEIFEPAVIDKLLASAGDTLAVGAPLARIRKPDEQEAQGARDAQEAKAQAEASVEPAAEPARVQSPPEPFPEVPPAAPPGIAPAGAGPDREAQAPPPASPAARTRARAAGVDLARLMAGAQGSGPGGAILLADVESALARAPSPAQVSSPAPAGEGAAPVRQARQSKPGLDMAAMRQAIGAAMSRSKREIPHYYLQRTIDLQPAVDWLASYNGERPPDRRLLMGTLFVRAVALAAAAAPELNGHYENGAFVPSAAVHAGLAVAMRGGGLIAPAIRDAADKPLDELMAAMRDLVARTRTGRLRNSEMTQGTITVTSIGEGGADALYGVIYPPQVAIVGFGAPVRRPWLVGEAVAPRTLVTLTLAGDHRVSDGRTGARLLEKIANLLGEPDKL